MLTEDVGFEYENTKKQYFLAFDLNVISSGH